MYEPFPGERAGEYSLDFVRGLRGNRERLLALTGNDLDRGVTLAPSGGAPDTGAASDRGEPAVSFAPSMGWAPAVALVLLAVAMTGAGVSLARRS